MPRAVETEEGAPVMNLRKHEKGYKRFNEGGWRIQRRFETLRFGSDFTNVGSMITMQVQ